jgi:tRNA 2-selenouridine synthase
MRDLGRFLASPGVHYMSASSLPVGLPVHPHQLEVQEFDSYELIVDLRSAAEYAKDHIPGAVSMPWSDKPAGAPASGGKVPLVAAEAPPLPYADAQLNGLQRDAAVLVYCDQGGVDSAALADVLRARGLTVDVLPGGWANFRRWVVTGLEILPRTLTFFWVRSLPGGVSQAVVAALAERDGQVLRLASLLGQHVLPGVSVPGESPPSPQFFDTLIVDALRRLDPGRVVWVDEVLPLAGSPGLPVPLHEALGRATAIRVDVPLDQRAALVARVLESRRSDGSTLIALLRRSVGASFARVLDAASRHVEQGQMEQGVAVLLRDCLDSLYSQLAAPDSDKGRTVRIASLGSAEFDAAVEALERGGDSAQSRP